MSVLSDQTIREEIEAGRIIIDPYPCDQDIQPASVDLRLAWSLKKFKYREYLMLGTDIQMYKIFPPGGYYDIPPGELILGSTYEHVGVPDHLVASVEGRSSMGRIGLSVHVTAGYIDPGFFGNITLEIKNHNSIPIRLWPTMPIAQIRFFELTTPSSRPYGSHGVGSHYQGSMGTVAARGDRGWTDR